MDYNERKRLAYNLRKAGYTYSYINDKTGISKSTLSGWFTGLPFKPNLQMQKKIGRARLSAIQSKKKNKLNSIKKAESKAISDIGSIDKRDLFILGIGIYIGEGSKTSNVVRITNSDPRVIKIMVKWFKEVVLAKKENISIRMYLHKDNNEKKCKKYWSKITGLSEDCFLKTQVDTRASSSDIKKKKLVHGTVQIGIKSRGNKELGVGLFRLIEAWQNRVLC